jgi:hypothetical protein
MTFISTYYSSLYSCYWSNKRVSIAKWKKGILSKNRLLSGLANGFFVFIRSDEQPDARRSVKSVSSRT